MPIFILVGKLVLLVCMKSVLIMSLPARTINKTPLNYRVRGTCVPARAFHARIACLIRYNAKGKSDCFNCKTGFFPRLFTPTFTKESNYNPGFLGEKSIPLWGIFNNYKEKLSVPRVQATYCID